jgi:hypothetical protein
MEPIWHTRQHAPQPSAVRSPCFNRSHFILHSGISLASSGRLTEDGCTSENPASSIRGRTYGSGQEAGPGILMERYVPVTTKERLLFPL